VEFLAGIGTNKVISKIACKLYKPEGVVILTKGGLPRVSAEFNYREIPGLGGSLGDRISKLFGNNLTMSELMYSLSHSFGSRQFKMLRKEFSQQELDKISDLSQGICYSPVEHRVMNQCMSSGKNNLSKFNLENFKLFPFFIL